MMCLHKKKILPIAASSLVLLMLSGCLLPTKHRLPVPKAPDVVQNATADELVAKLNDRWKAFDSLNVTVDIKASILKSKEGVSKDYPVFRGHILMRKPAMLRVLGQYPMVGGRMFDLASDGSNFTLYIPPKGKAIRGTTKHHKRSATLEENLNPSSFFDAMIVRGLEPNDLYMVTADTETIEDPTRKHLYQTPEYVLSIMRTKPGSQELEPVRVVIFHREDLLPYEQDLYDVDGNLETQVAYSKYTKTGTQMYPGMVTIKRPIEEYQLIMTVDKVIPNMTLTDDQFQIKVPDDIKIQKLDEAKPDAAKP
jgi:outer membrane lipoprotein-sorting protein